MDQSKRKTETAWKISAAWTPGEELLASAARHMFGEGSPLRIRGGRLTINAAISLDMADPMKAARAAERVNELQAELATSGILHTFSTQAGTVPLGLAERLPEPSLENGAAS